MLSFGGLWQGKHMGKCGPIWQTGNYPSVKIYIKPHLEADYIISSTVFVSISVKMYRHLYTTDGHIGYITDGHLLVISDLKMWLMNINITA